MKTRKSKIEMTNRQFVLYLRVSTARQGASGLGLEAQRALVAPYERHIIATYQDVESGKRADRPNLARALEHCKRENACLLIAKVDRLSRDVEFLFKIKNSGVDILAADAPHMGTLEWGIRAVFAQHEREEISRRTKAALAAAKARGVKLGSPNPAAGGRARAKAGAARVRACEDGAWSAVKALHDNGASLRRIADYLNEDEAETARGGRWHASTVRNLLLKKGAI
jgi:DNA invertase Pin-like site-specific DNA recombinase